MRSYVRRAGLQCPVEDCGRQVWARGMCRKHYSRWHANGDPAVVKIRQSEAGAPMAFIEALPMEGEACILWPYSKNNQGYAQIAAGPNGKKALVSRVVCERRHGPSPSPSHQAAHSCGKGHLSCIAPYHLSWKSPKENQADRNVHGTIHLGSQSHLAKLTEDQVRAIRALEGTATQGEIGRRFGVSQTAIGLIIRRERWGWLA